MFRRLVLLFFVLSLSSMAFAGRIAIAEPECLPTDTDVTQLNNGFSVIPINGGGTFGFCNKTGVDWTSLLMAIRTSLTQDQVVCDSTAFFGCKVSSDPSVPGVVYVLFAGVFPNGIPPLFPPFPGVPNNERFTVDLDCNPGDICGTPPLWPDGTEMFGYANFEGGTPPVPPGVPEPASAALLLSGLAAGYIRRKKSNG